ncbi:MAG: AAA family ATPase [Leptospiraceae bacterium]|nr:AAA family ATPase [Leptospiraceae bacterium]
MKNREKEINNLEFKTLTDTIQAHTKKWDECNTLNDITEYYDELDDLFSKLSDSQLSLENQIKDIDGINNLLREKIKNTLNEFFLNYKNNFGYFNYFYLRFKTYLIRYETLFQTKDNFNDISLDFIDSKDTLFLYQNQRVIEQELSNKRSFFSSRLKTIEELNVSFNEVRNNLPTNIEECWDYINICEDSIRNLDIKIKEKKQEIKAVNSNFKLNNASLDTYSYPDPQSKRNAKYKLKMDKEQNIINIEYDIEQIIFKIREYEKLLIFYDKLVRSAEKKSKSNNKSSPNIKSKKSPKVNKQAIKSLDEDYSNVKPVRSLKDLLQDVDNLVGIIDVKKEIHNLSSFVQAQLKRSSQGLKKGSLNLHYVFKGNPGTGKTMVARLIAELYHHIGILKSDKLIETDRSGLVGEYLGQTSIKTNQIIDSAIGGVLFIDEAYSLTSSEKDDYGQEAISILLKRMEDERGSFIVIVAGYPKEMDIFISSNPGLKSRFSNEMIFSNYTPKELAEIFYFMVKKSDYELSVKLKNKIEGIFKKESSFPGFANARTARNLLDRIVRIHGNRLLKIDKYTKKDLSTINEEDIDLYISEGAKSNQGVINEEEIQSILLDIQNMTGLETVKREIQDLVALAKLELQKQLRNISSNYSPSHMVFYGNPGTGKTTVARMLGNIFKSLGLLKSGHVVEVSRSELVAGYVGQTNEKTDLKIKEALDGILFIDEAYTLSQGNNPNDFGKDALDTILRRMEEYRERLIVIIAGYDREIQQFLKSNSGLKSRFNTFLKFEDYTSVELYNIFVELAEKEGLSLEKDISKIVIGIIQNEIDTNPNFGNVRFVRNLLQSTKKKQARRLANSKLNELSEEELRTLIKSDFV